MAKSPFVDGVGKLRPERLRGAAENHEKRASVSSFGVELAKQAVVMAAGTIDADLVVPRHLVVHGFPETATRKTLRRGGRDRDQDGDKLGSDRPPGKSRGSPYRAWPRSGRRRHAF